MKERPIIFSSEMVRAILDGRKSQMRRAIKPLRRHRLFETSFPPGFIPSCQHNNLSTIGVYGGGQHPRRRTRSINRPMDMATSNEAEFGIKARRIVMGIHWMTGRELNQAIPPAYTEFIGKQILAILGRTP